MSDYDINRLIDKFLEYAEMQKRNIAIEVIETPADDNNDYSKLKNFKQLFTSQKSPSKHDDVHDNDEEMISEEDSEMARIRMAILEERSFCKQVTARVAKLKPKYSGIQKFIGRSRVKTDSFLGAHAQFNNERNQMTLRLRASTEGYSAIRHGVDTRMVSDTKGSNKSILGRGENRASMTLKSSSISTEMSSSMATSRSRSKSTPNIHSKAHVHTRTHMVPGTGRGSDAKNTNTSTTISSSSSSSRRGDYVERNRK